MISVMNECEINRKSAVSDDLSFFEIENPEKTRVSGGRVVESLFNGGNGDFDVEKTRVLGDRVLEPIFSGGNGDYDVEKTRVLEPIFSGGNGDYDVEKTRVLGGRVSSEVGAGEIRVRVSETNTGDLRLSGGNDDFRVEECEDYSELDSKEIEGKIEARVSEIKVIMEPKVSLEVDLEEIEEKINARVLEIRAGEQPFDHRNGDFSVGNAAMEDSIIKSEENRVSFGEMAEMKSEETRVSFGEMVEERSVSGLSSSRSMLDEGTIVGSLDTMLLDGTKHLSYGFEPGEMVWGKVKSHPWWPGHVFNEAFATSSVRRTKHEGHVLVAFFGDNSYGWFDPAELIPFEPYYEEKSRQTNFRNFVIAVEDAVVELRRRCALGLTCYCRNPKTFRPTTIRGFLAVNVDGYEPGGVYSAKQIKKARESFKPVEVLSFVQKLALMPRNDGGISINQIKNVATIFAYRKAVFEEFDVTYAQAFGVEPVRPSRNSYGALEQPGKVPPRAPLSGPMVIAEALGERKNATKPVKAKDQSKKDKYLFKRRDEPNEQRVVPKPDFHHVSQVHANVVPLPPFNLPAVDSPVPVGGFVLQKRPPAVMEKHSLRAKQEQSGTIIREVNNFSSAEAPQNANRLDSPNVIAVDFQKSQPLLYGGIPAVVGVSEDRKVQPELVGKKMGVIKETKQMKLNESPGPTGTSMDVSYMPGQLESSANVGGRKPSVLVPVGARLEQDRVMELGGSRAVLESVGIAQSPVDVQPPGKFATASTDVVNMAANVVKRPREALSSWKSDMGEKKKKKKRDSGQETNLKHAQKRPKITTDGDSSRISAGKSIGITPISLQHPQTLSQSKDHGIHSSFNSDSAVPSPKLDIGSFGLDLKQLLNELLDLAIDPFNGIERQATVYQGFLRFRSLVYEKSLALQSIIEPETSASKSATSKSLQEPGIGNADIPSSGEVRERFSSKSLKHAIRPNDSPKMGQKRGPSDRQEEMSAKRLKKLNQIKALSSEKKAGGQKKLDGQSEERKETSKPMKPEPPLRAAQPASLVMEFPPRTTLPSVPQLKARFGRFGPLDLSGTRINWKVSTCWVAFKRKSDAQAAYNSVQNNAAFGHLKVNSYLQELDVPEPGLPKTIKQRVEDNSRDAPQIGVQLKSCLKKPSGEEVGSSAVSVPRVKFLLGGEESNKGGVKNNGSTSDGASSLGLDFNSKSIMKTKMGLPLVPFPPGIKPVIHESSGNSQFSNVHPHAHFHAHFREVERRNNNSVEESNKGEVFVGVKKNGGSVDGASSLGLDFNSKNMMTTKMVFPPPITIPPANKPVLHESLGSIQFSNVHHAHFSEVERRNNNNVDISHQMLSLLMRCNDVVSDVKRNLGYVPYHPL
ncbi:PWWP domain-containing protein 1-like [Tasmannia lanceolata]|uniref:PWWP domain-containing protein 1-like n=1 Tax=Tasmannia lanceolata TaxID=3420 RepID=UPI004063A6AA